MKPDTVDVAAEDTAEAIVDVWETPEPVATTTVETPVPIRTVSYEAGLAIEMFNVPSVVAAGEDGETRMVDTAVMGEP